MKLLVILSHLAILCAPLSLATDWTETYNALSDKRKNAVDECLSMPLTDFICTPHSKKKHIAYQIALSKRPEFKGIDWDGENCVELARQLWHFQSQERNSGYTISLKSVLKMLMESHGLKESKITEINRITSGWIRARNRRITDRRYLFEKSEEEKHQRRQKRYLKYRQRREAMKGGERLPLLDYFTIPEPRRCSLDEILEEALRYKHKYSSSQSFRASLRSLYKSLGYTDDQMYYQYRDRRTFTCPLWPDSKPEESHSAETHQEPTDILRNSVEAAMSFDNEDNGLEDWSDFQLDDLELGDIDTSFQHPPESFFDGEESLDLHYMPYDHEGDSSSSHSSHDMDSSLNDGYISHRKADDSLTSHFW